MRFLFVGLLLFAGTLLPGCARRTFQGQALAPAALAAHRTVAILPFTVGLERLQDMARPRVQWTDSIRRPLALFNETNRQRWGERQQLGYQLQAELQAALMRWQAAHASTVTFQNPAETNQRLERAGITYASLPAYSMAQLRAALGADAVLSGQTDMRQLLPGGVGIAVFVLTNNVNNPMADNRVRTLLDIYDTQSGQVVWRFDHELRGQASISPAALAKALVRNMQGVFPYAKK